MSKYKYTVTQIGKLKLNEPVFMTMATIKKSKSTSCYKCGSKIKIGETYYYHEEECVCYCIACIGVAGDPDDLLSFEIPEYKYEDDLEKEIDFE